jgi:hypothetical protein
MELSDSGIWQLSSIPRVYRSSFPQAFIPTVERLYTHDLLFGRGWQGNLETPNGWNFYIHLPL